jgi:hypothetical protein
MAIVGVVLSGSSLYLSWRVGGDLWAHFYFASLDRLSLLLLAPATLLVCEIIALVLGITGRSSSWRHRFEDLKPT